MIDRPTFSIRDAVAGEHAQLSILAQRAKAHSGYPPDWMAQWSRQLTISAEYVERHRVEVAVDAASRVIGVCALEDHGDHFQLEHLWIDPAAQRMGIGSLGARVVGRQPAPMPRDPDRSLPIMEFRNAE